MVCYFYSVSRLLIWYDLSQRRWNNKLYLLLLKTKPLVSHAALLRIWEAKGPLNSYLHNSTRRIFLDISCTKKPILFHLITEHIVSIRPLSFVFFFLSAPPPPPQTLVDLKICFWNNKIGRSSLPLRRNRKINLDSLTRLLVRRRRQENFDRAKSCPLRLLWASLSAGQGRGASPSFISHLFLTDEFPVWLSSWQHPNFAAARAPSAHSPPLKHPCRGFLHSGG